MSDDRWWEHPLTLMGSLQTVQVQLSSLPNGNQPMPLQITVELTLIFLSGHVILATQDFEPCCVYIKGYKS